MEQSIQDQIQEKAQLAIDQFQNRTKGKLDLSRESLASIDEILAEAADFVFDMSDYQIDSIVHLMGSYILAVASKEFPGKFYWSEEQDQPVFVAGEPDFHIAIMSFNKVRGRLNGDSGDNIEFFYRGFANSARKPAPNTKKLYI